MEKFEAAVSCLRRSLELNAVQPDTHNNLGCALRDLGQLDLAEASFRQTLRIDPGHAMGLLSVSNLLSGQERYGELADILEEIVRQRPEIVEPRLRLGDALLRLERYNEAVRCFEAAVGLSPGQHDTHAGLGIALAAVKRLEESVASFEVARDPAGPADHQQEPGHRPPRPRPARRLRWPCSIEFWRFTPTTPMHTSIRG